MTLKEQTDAIYRKLPPDRIPWNLDGPPALLKQLVESRWVLPCKAVDLGCGSGNCAVWLAAQGFQMTGLDLSPRAIELARQLASSNAVACHFMVQDLTGDLAEHESSFDFAYDWEVLHHVFPENRERYVGNVHRILHPGASYLSVCFSIDDTRFGGEGRYRRTPLGTTLYFSSEEELQQLFEPLFFMEKLGTSEVAGKYGQHMVVSALMKRRSSFGTEVPRKEIGSQSNGTASVPVIPSPANRQS